MKLPYETPEVELIDFRVLEKLATNNDPELDLDPVSGLGGNLGVGDWG